MSNTAPAGASASATPERGNGTLFNQVREARTAIRSQGAMSAVRVLLQSQLQERRAMAEALKLDVKYTPNAGEAIKLLELKETPAAPLPADVRIDDLETRLGQFEAALLEIDEKAQAIFEARLDARVKSLETRSFSMGEAEKLAEIALREAMTEDPDDSPEGAALEDRIGDIELSPPDVGAGGVPDEDAHERAAVEKAIADRRTMSTGEAA